MGDDTKTEILQVFTEKIDEIKAQFDAERVRRRQSMTFFFAGFAVMVLTFAFSAGMIVQKINSLESNYYRVADKVETLYLVAVANGDINLDVITRGEND
jgi:hypothetical protein